MRDELRGLDAWITGHYGEDQFKPWDCGECEARGIDADEPICPHCGWNPETGRVESEDPDESAEPKE